MLLLYKMQYRYMKDKQIQKQIQKRIQKTVSIFLNHFYSILQEPKIDYLDQVSEMLSAHIISADDIAPSYWERQKQILKREGRWHEFVDGELSDEFKWNEIQRIITEQKTSLMVWIQYLTQEASFYDPWLKYWVMRSVVQLQKINKQKGKFEKRTKRTIASFPELSREALGYTIDIMSKYLHWEDVEFEDEILKKSVENHSFSEIYAYYSVRTRSQKNILQNTDGIWVKYPQWSDHMKLVATLKWKHTGWCTVSESTARWQLNLWDFYVYYTIDINGYYTIPRIAIRMEGWDIQEIRGVKMSQELEEDLFFILEHKLIEFWEIAERYKQRMNDVNRLTHIYDKSMCDEELTREELIFIYEIEAPIRWFWYEKDPRIEQILLYRDAQKDLLKIFDGSIQEISGDIDLSGLTNLPEGMHFPTKIWWDLCFFGLNALPKNCILPREVWWDVFLPNIIDIPDWVQFPEVIWGRLDLAGIQTFPSHFRFPRNIGRGILLSALKEIPEGLEFPQRINWGLSLSSLKDIPENFTFPKYIKWALNLSSLETIPAWVTLPEHVEGTVSLYALKAFPPWCRLPERIWHHLDLSSLETLSSHFEFPRHIGWDLYLRDVRELPKWCKFPATLSGALDLRSLKVIPDTVIFPQTISWSLDLRSIRQLSEWLKLPEHIWWNLDLVRLRHIPRDFSFPDYVWRNLYLDGLVSLPRWFYFPKSIAWKVTLPRHLHYAKKYDPFGNMHSSDQKAPVLSRIPSRIYAWIQKMWYSVSK